MRLLKAYPVIKKDYPDDWHEQLSAKNNDSEIVALKNHIGYVDFEKDFLMEIK